MWRYTNVGASGRGLLVELDDPLPQGARVELVAGERSQWREGSTAGGFQAALPAHVHFGLGTVEGPLTLRVHWPGGQTTEMEGALGPRVVARRPVAGEEEL